MLSQPASHWPQGVGTLPLYLGGACALLAAPVDAFMDAASDEARGILLTPLFTPTETCSLEGSSEGMDKEELHDLILDCGLPTQSYGAQQM